MCTGGLHIIDDNYNIISWYTYINLYLYTYIMYVYNNVLKADVYCNV